MSNDVTNELSVIEDMVNSINAYNASDMLDGYLDEMAEDFNKRLGNLGLTTITVVHPE